MTGMYFNPILHLNMTRKWQEQKLRQQSDHTVHTFVSTNRVWLT